ncbi:MAG: hypothetical protein COT84_02900 [Chlamydiae bacterium CG10_big_fil_rev_8_21_14_0_10_35_9]|nr:MAG: hypothetical protein COT84_02900 [Chlamydiae bacterium CG10_big_fil_rev_8_21_14_0_10_35_9]
MKYLFLLLFPFALMSKVHQGFNQKNSFFYSNVGGYYAGEDINGVDIGLGYRRIYKVSALDINIGTTLVGINEGNIEGIIPFFQGAYLAYPLKWNGPYLGAGITVVPLFMNGLPLLANFPLIVGYQTASKEHPMLIQLQGSFFSVPGATLTLGVGF